MLAMKGHSLGRLSLIQVTQLDKWVLEGNILTGESRSGRGRSRKKRVKCKIVSFSGAAPTKGD